MWLYSMDSKQLMWMEYQITKDLLYQLEKIGQKSHPITDNRVEEYFVRSLCRGWFLSKNKGYYVELYFPGKYHKEVLL